MAVNFTIWTTRRWKNNVDLSGGKPLWCHLFLGKCKWPDFKIHWGERVEINSPFWAGEGACTQYYFDRWNGLAGQAPHRKWKWNGEKDQNWIFKANGWNQKNPRVSQRLCNHKYALGAWHSGAKTLWKESFGPYAKFLRPKISVEITRWSPTRFVRRRFHHVSDQDKRLLRIWPLHPRQRRSNAPD